MRSSIPPPRISIHVNHLEFFCKRLAPVCLFLHIFYFSTYFNRVSWIFILYWSCNSIQNHLFCCSNCSSFQPLGALLVGCVSLTYPRHVVCVCLWALLDFLALQKCSRHILWISCSSPIVSHFCKKPWFHVQEMVQETKIQALDKLIFTGVFSSRPSQGTK